MIVTPFYQGERGKELRDLLEGLGTTEREVAEKLMAEGCRGSSCSPGSCPVSRYLTKKLNMHGGPGRGLCKVRTEQSGCYLDRFDPWETIGKANLPAPVYAFIRTFDVGGWPQLSIAYKPPQPA
jgi:hypothetical protein